MPAKNPRLTVTLPPSVYTRVRRISNLTGQSASAFIAEMLDSGSPTFKDSLTVPRWSPTSPAYHIKGSRQRSINSIGTFDRMILILEAAVRVRSQFAANLAAAQSKIESGLGIDLESKPGAPK